MPFRALLLLAFFKALSAAALRPWANVLLHAALLVPLHGVASLALWPLLLELGPGLCCLASCCCTSLGRPALQTVGTRIHGSINSGCVAEVFSVSAKLASARAVEAVAMSQSFLSYLYLHTCI